MRKLLSDRFPRRSTFAWAVLGLYILVYDVVAISLNDVNRQKGSSVRYETFSDGCWRGVEHPVVRWPIWAAILILVKHLAAPDFLRKYDPIGLVGKMVRFITKRSCSG